MKTKALVTGGMGFIGSNVVELLLENGYEVVIVDDFSTSENVPPDVDGLPFRLEIDGQRVDNSSTSWDINQPPRAGN